MLQRGKGFWWIYAGAWVPVIFVYTGIFLIEGTRRGWEAPIAALANVVPAAMLGSVAVVGTDTIRWSSGRRFGFLLTHLVLALAYASLWHLGVGLAFALLELLQGGSWTLRFLAGPAVPWLLFQGTTLYVVVAGLSYTTQVVQQLRNQELRTAHAESRAARAEALRAAAELHTLRTQLNPHFLFNTLHTLNALVQRDGEAASRAIERLASLFRYTLDVREDTGDDIPFREEWSFVRDYLSLEELRLCERLEIAMVADPDALNVLIPAFTLQPIVENAVRHGVAPRARGGRVTVSAAIRNDRLRIEVSDDGPGADRGAVQISRGLGLSLVRRRLAFRYGEQASLDIATSPGRGFSVVIQLPVDPPRHLASMSP